EKNTGFLLNSTFIYEFGIIIANYSLTLVSSNYFEVEGENGISGYNLLLIFVSLGIIILLSTKVKFKKIKNY
ncbi:MAG: hypothetical protein ACFFDX_13545, partial [Candidatus Odinarchaeota archaeon]